MLSLDPSRAGLAVVALAVASAGLAACHACNECSDDFDPAYCVVVSITDADGNVVQPDQVTYSIDGEAPRPCRPTGGAWGCGRDRTGSYSVDVVVPGRPVFNLRADVTRSACGWVITQYVGWVIDPDGGKPELHVVHWVVDASLLDAGPAGLVDGGRH